ncbi:MAG: sugar ABC transporter permease [Propionibacteriaceae bacterium]|nr:sugar ABC transporter permease [Propionibacteriaceae bacterium]
MSSTVPSTKSPLSRRAKLSRFDVKASPYFYIAPFFIVFAIMGLFPLFYTVFISTRKWNSVAGDQGVAAAYCNLDNAGDCKGVTSWMGNFQWALSNPDFVEALRNTIAIFLLSSIPQIIIAILLAFVLSSNLRAKTFWRMGVLFPYIIAPMAAGIIFRQVFADETGVVNQIITGLGLPAVSWHANTFASWVAVSTIVNFRWIGYNTLVILAAMQAVPNETIEAAVIDGAGRVRQLLSITLPMIRPTLIFVIITSTIGGLQIFDEPQMYSEGTTYGGSNNQFLTLTQFMWKTGFVSTNDSNMGRAAAISWMLFLLVVVFAILSYILTSRISSGASNAPKTSKRARKAASR